MAEGVDLSFLTASLKRLSKDDLVQIILKKRLEGESGPGQDKLKATIYQHLNQTPVATPNDDTDSELQKMEIQCLKRESVLLHQSVNDLKYTIQLQKDVIYNLKKHENHNLPGSSTVAIQKNNTEAILNNSVVQKQGTKQYATVAGPKKPHQQMATQGNQNNNKEDDTKQNEFKSVTHKKPKKGYPKLVGNNVGSNLKAVVKRKSLYISRLDTSTTDEAIKKHLVENGIGSCEIKLGSSKHPEIYKSFIITVPETIIEKVKNPEL